MNQFRFGQVSLSGSRRLLLMALLIGVVVLGMSRQVAYGAGLTVTTTTDVINGADGLCSLREAVIAANNNSASGGAAGECAAGQDGVTDTITLDGGATYALTLTGGGDLHDLDFTNNSVAVDLIITTDDLTNATITQNATPDDRVMHINGGANVELHYLTITGGNNSVAGEPGPGIHTDNSSTLLIDNSTITGNTTSHNGGGLYVENNVSVTITNSTISNNNASRGGGIYYHTSNQMTITNSVIDNNTASDFGGGIFQQFGTGLVVLDNTDLTNNDVGSNGGGGINVGDGASLTVQNGSLIDGNTANNQVGGGINVRPNAVVNISNTVISNNTAIDGAGLTNDNGTVTIGSGTEFIGNTSTTRGGAVFIESGTTTISGVLFTGNSANTGGAVHLSNGMVDILSSNLYANMAVTSGNAIHSNRNVVDTFEINASCIIGNTGAASDARNNQAAQQDASGNWWGDPAGANGTGETTSGLWDVSSPLASAPAACADSTVTVSGSGAGSGTVTGTEITCAINAGTPSGDCSETYGYGTPVSLTAAANVGSAFGAWTGCDSTSGGSNEVCHVTMTSAKNVSASFTTTGSAPTITSTNAVTFVESTVNSFTVTATGSPAPTFSISGALPPGVSFNSTSGVLSGQPGVGFAGVYPLTITAMNGNLPNATQNFTLTVVKAAVAAEPGGHLSCVQKVTGVSFKIRNLVNGTSYIMTVEVRNQTNTTVFMIRRMPFTFGGPNGTQTTMKALLFPVNDVPGLAAPATYNPAWTSLSGTVDVYFTIVNVSTNTQTQTVFAYTCATGAVTKSSPTYGPISNPLYGP